MSTERDILRFINPYVAIEGILPPSTRTFHPVALKPLRIVTKALLLFLNICGLKMLKNKFRYLH